MSKKNLYILIIIGLVILGYNFLSKKNKILPEEASHNIVTARNIAADIDGTELKDKIDNQAELNELLSLKESDIFWGDTNSPVTIIEYSSLSCPHCKYFHENILSFLKEKYVDQGKLKIIHRDYPLDGPSLAGAIYLKCINKEKYFDHLKLLFDKQADWAYKSNYREKLADFAKIDGMSEDEFNNCLADKEKEKQVLDSRMVAEKKMKLSATPVYIINGKMYFGLKEKDFFEAKIEELLANNNSNEQTNMQNPQNKITDGDQNIVDKNNSPITSEQGGHISDKEVNKDINVPETPDIKKSEDHLDDSSKIQNGYNSEEKDQDKANNNTEEKNVEERKFPSHNDETIKE